ncbi:hypothetical protein ACWDUK_21990 [Streptomyces cellulosae]
MRAHELTVGRTFGVTFDHGEDFFEALSTSRRAGSCVCRRSVT